MKFQPKTQDQIERENLLPAGTYDYEVLQATDKTSKSGNDMIHLKLKVFRPEGGFVYADDYLLEKMAFKLIHFCHGAGLEDKYNAGELAASDCIGRTGKCDLIIDEQAGFPPKNAIKDYIAPKQAPAGIGAQAPSSVQRRTTVHASAPQPAVSAPGDDEPPF
jgi:hypothetical protein